MATSQCQVGDLSSQGPAESPPCVDEFLLAYLAHEALAIRSTSKDANDAMVWMLSDNVDSPSSFRTICELYEADHLVVRREILRRFHEDRIRSIRSQEPNWDVKMRWYFGNGEPTALAPEQLAAILEVPYTDLLLQVFQADPNSKPMSDPPWIEARMAIGKAA